MNTIIDFIITHETIFISIMGILFVSQLFILRNFEYKKYTYLFIFSFLLFLLSLFENKNFITVSLRINFYYLLVYSLERHIYKHIYKEEPILVQKYDEIGKKDHILYDQHPIRGADIIFTTTTVFFTIVLLIINLNLLQ